MNANQKSFETPLKKWGTWKRYSVTVGAGASVFYGISRKLPHGDGCKNGGKNIEHLNGTQWRADPVAERVNSVVMTLQDMFGIEMFVLSHRYVYDWSVRRIAGELGSSRTSVTEVLRRAKSLVESRYTAPTQK